MSEPSQPESYKNFPPVNAEPNAKTYPLEGDEIILEALQKRNLISADRIAHFQTIDPDRPDYLMARTNAEGKVVKMETISGEKLRRETLLLELFHNRKKLTPEESALSKKLEMGHPRFEELKNRTVLELIALFPDLDDKSRKKWTDEILKYEKENDKPSIEDMNESLRKIHAVDKSMRDISDAWRAEAMLREARKRKLQLERGELPQPTRRPEEPKKDAEVKQRDFESFDNVSAVREAGLILANAQAATKAETYQLPAQIEKATKRGEGFKVA